jgi:hypothetical protein
MEDSMKARDVKGTKSNRIVAQRGKVLPKRLYSKWLIDDVEAPWIDTEEKMEDLAEKGETVYIGEYRLVKVHKVDLKLRIA